MSQTRPESAVRRILRAKPLARLKEGLPRHSRGKNPFFARAGGNTVGGPLPAGRATRGAGALITLVLFMAAGRWYASQRFTVTAQVERVIRAEAIPQLERQLGVKVEVGRVQSDWLSRVILSDVTIGPDSTLPTGALARARTITLDMDLVGVATGRNPLPGGLKAVALESPSIYLARDTAGNWNLARLMPKEAGGAGAGWDGIVTWTDGRVYLRDEATKNSAGEPLLADSRGISGQAEVASGGPTWIQAVAPETLLGTKTTKIGAVTARGALEVATNQGALALELPPIPLAATLDYAVPARDARAYGGTVAGTMEADWRGGQFYPRGRLHFAAADVEAALPAGSMPVAKNRLRVSDLSGPVRFAGTSFATDGVNFSAEGTRWQGAGTVSTQPHPVFDIRLASKNVDTARALALLPGKAPLARLKNGPLAVSLRASGTAQSAILSGALSTDSLDAVLTSGERAIAGKTSAAFSLAVPASNPRGTARFSLSGVRAATKGTSARLANLTGSLALGNGQAQVQLDSGAAQFHDTRYGALSAATVRLVTSSTRWDKGPWRGRFQVNQANAAQVNLRNLAPQAADLVKEIRPVNVSGSFVNLTPRGLEDPALAVRARLDGGGVRVQTEELGTVEVGTSVANAFYSQGSVRVTGAHIESEVGPLDLDLLVNPRGVARWTARSPRVRIPAARINTLLAPQGLAMTGDVTGTVSVSTTGEADSPIAAAFDLLLPDSSLQSLGASMPGGPNKPAPQRRARFVNARLRGQANYDVTSGEWSTTSRINTALGETGSGTLGRTGVELPPELAGTRVGDAQITVRADGKKGAARRVLADITAARLALPSMQVGQENTPPITLRDTRALVEVSGDSWKVTRLQSRWGQTGDISGTAESTPNGPSAQILAHSLDLEQIQKTLVPASLATARLKGRLATQVDLRPRNGTLVPSIDAVIRNGSLTTGNTTVPLDVATAVVEPERNGVVQILELVAWTRGGRLSATGRVAPLPSGESSFSGDIAVRDFPLGELATLPGLTPLRTEAGADGLISGDFKARLDSRPSLNGAVQLKLATAYGMDIERVAANVAVDGEPGALKLQVTNLQGSAEGAPFTGEVIADEAANTWRAQLKSTRISAAGLARAASVTPTTLAFRGDIGADVDLTGTLLQNGELSPQPTAGYLKVRTGPLTWQGREIGALDSDIVVENGTLVARSITLNRKDAKQPLVQVTGGLPLPGTDQKLDLKLKVQDADLPYVFQFMEESRDLTRALNRPFPLLERVTTFVDSLPPGTSGRVGAEAHITGTYQSPRVDVTNLTLREGRARVPMGGLSPPATLDAALVVEDGSVILNRGEFRLKKSVALARDANDDEPEDTVLRLNEGGKITPDGPIALSAEVLNANLSELATWVPALRGSDNASTLRGNLSLFTFTVAGTTSDPVVAGSIQAEQISFSKYDLDWLRVNYFEIKDNYITVEPNRVAVKKGRFTYQGASGRVPWSWSTPGPVLDAPLSLHVPVTNKDFGGIIGVFLPALQAADAKEFAGAINVSGTIAQPKVDGAVKISGGTLRLDPVQTALEAGIADLAGTVRFVNGNRVEIDESDPIRARLITADEVEAREVREPRRKRTDTNPELAGRFTLRGNVTLNLGRFARFLTPTEDDEEEETGRPELWAARHRYDLSLSVDGARYNSPQISGLTNVALGAIWRTQGDVPERGQNIRWMLAGEGASQNKSRGRVFSVGNLRLSAFFGTGIGAFLNSQAQDFAGEADFAAMPVSKRVDLKALPDLRSQLVVEGLGVTLKDVGTGQLDGRIVVDNRAAGQPVPAAAAALRAAQLTPRVRAALRRPRLLGTGIPATDDFRAGGYADFPRAWETQATTPGRERNSLRLAGELTLSNAEFYGVPAGGGVPMRLSILPEAPRLDMKVLLGRNVQIVTSALRSGLVGEIVAKGTPQNPEIYGTLATRDGQVRFPNARARIEDGQITLAATHDLATDFLRTRAEVDVTAKGTSGRYEITLRLRGPLDVNDSSGQNLRVEVSSNPPLSQNDAFAQLLGTAVRNESGEVDRAYAEAVVSVVTAPLFSGVENTLAQAFGLSSFTLEYRFNEPVFVQLSKNIGDRALITYRRTIGGYRSGERAPYQLRVDYRIKGNVSVGLQLDEQNVRTLTLQKGWRF